VNNEISFVAFPVQINSSPVASGSSVPEWPTFIGDFSLEKAMELTELLDQINKNKS